MFDNAQTKQRNDNRLRIVVGGYIVGGPLGGLVWHHLQYLLGLRALGHDVLFVEDSDDYPSCYNPQVGGLCNDPSYGLAFAKKVFEQHDLKERWAYHHRSSSTWYGLSEQAVKEFALRADVFMNLSGMHPMGERFQRIPIRVLIDTDPVFTQIKHLTNAEAYRRAAAHNCFLTYGENWGAPDCSIPDDGFPWQPTRQPVYLSAWPVTDGNEHAPWSTVMQWNSYQTRTHKGREYGMKSQSFEPFYNLPQEANEQFLLAMGSATAPRETLVNLGWNLVNSLTVTQSPERYQQFIQESKGEWSVAKQGYVLSNSGWFSERTAGYLASGRPAVVQDTGWTKSIEGGRGLFAFKTIEEAKEALQEVSADYCKHCRWAREVAEENFSSKKILHGLLNDCFCKQTETA